MRRVLVLAVFGLWMPAVLAGGLQVPVTTASDYGALVHEYRSGNAEEAVARIATLNGQSLENGFRAFWESGPSDSLLRAAVAMHTEAALRPRMTTPPLWADRHLGLAAAIVEIGNPRKLKQHGSPDLKRSAPALPLDYRRLWFLTVITTMQQAGRVADADSYLESARSLFPHDANILLLSGIAQEVRASNRIVSGDAGDRRKALGYAEVYLRASLDLAPNRVETRLRLGRVLFQRRHADEARPLLTGVADASDGRASYLASLFLGELEDAAGNTAGAAQWYARASARVPSAQVARLAGSELRHRAGERQEAQAAVASAIGAGNSTDPWWGYLFGEYWRVDLYLDGLRKLSRS